MGCCVVCENPERKSRMGPPFPFHDVHLDLDFLSGLVWSGPGWDKVMDGWFLSLLNRCFAILSNEGKLLEGKQSWNAASVVSVSSSSFSPFATLHCIISAIASWHQKFQDQESGSFFFSPVSYYKSPCCRCCHFIFWDCKKGASLFIVCSCEIFRMCCSLPFSILP